MKRIFIDYSIFMYRAIFGTRHNADTSATYTALNMILACLRRIGVEPEDELYLATDYMGSWRKRYEKEYKGNRKAFRESFTDIDWKKQYSAFDQLLQDLDNGTSWHVLRKENMEADDFMAIGSRYYKDDEVILITYDSDLQQMWHYDNVKIFSPILKPKRYKVKPTKFNAYKLLDKKIKKEVSDNLTNPIISEKDYDNRIIAVNLLELPDFVEIPLREIFDKIQPKEEYNSDNVPFTSMREKINNLYNDKKDLITYDKSVEIEEKKKNKIKKKRKIVKKKSKGVTK